jgi:hypothetical protein
MLQPLEISSENVRCTQSRSRPSRRRPLFKRSVSRLTCSSYTAKILPSTEKYAARISFFPLEKNAHRYCKKSDPSNVLESRTILQSEKNEEMNISCEVNNFWTTWLKSRGGRRPYRSYLSSDYWKWSESKWEVECKCGTPLSPQLDPARSCLTINNLLQIWSCILNLYNWLYSILPVTFMIFLHNRCIKRS